MLRRISTKLKSKPRHDSNPHSPNKTAAVTAEGAAVPYSEPQLPPTPAQGSVRSHNSSIGGASSLLTNSSSECGEGHLMGEAAARGDTEAIRQLLKSGYDINCKDEVCIWFNLRRSSGCVIVMWNLNLFTGSYWQT